ncbi:hypothetical protein, partial [Seonamhaeicola sp.]|uniref:hypothetical protein n=1 Tax=Seonamhaeicola sp. TaxID=1912245 RepID=UPI00356481AF
MKKIVTIALIAIFYACSSGDDSNSENINNLFGNWEMYSYIYDTGEDFFEDVDSKDYLHQIEFIEPDT